MSTRSGKRIHGSVHENITKSDNDVGSKMERKTRSRRLKENCDEVTVSKSKKRHNYVSYPIDDELNDFPSKIQTNGEVLIETVKTTLKEQDLNVSNRPGDEIDSGTVVRQTRRTKKFSENVPEEIPVVEIAKVKGKKNKKKKKKQATPEVESNENNVIEVAKKSRRRKGKTSGSETVAPVEVVKDNLKINKSNCSTDSFHSAAGSPNSNVVITEIEKCNGSVGKSPRRASKRFKADSFEDNLSDEPHSHNGTTDNSSKKIKLSICRDELEKSNSFIHVNAESVGKNTTFDKANDIVEVLNTTFEQEPKSQWKSSVKNSTFDKTLNTSGEKAHTASKVDETYKEENVGRKKSLRSTFDKTDTPSKGEEKLNSTYERINTSDNVNKTFELQSDSGRQKSLRLTLDKIEIPQKFVKKLNSTFEKNKTPQKVDDTLDKRITGRRKSLRSTYDKADTPSKGVEELNSTQTKINTLDKINKTFELDEDKGKRKSLRLTSDKIGTPSKPAKNINTTFEKDNTPSTLDQTFENNRDRRKSLRSTFVGKIDSPSEDAQSLNTTFEKASSSLQNGTSEYDKSGNNYSRLSTRADRQNTRNSTMLNIGPNTSESSKLNSTFDKSKEARYLAADTTFDKSKDYKQSTHNSTFDKSKDSRQSAADTAFDKSKDSKHSTLNSTFDKESKHNSTYEKPGSQSESDAKSSLISSDSNSNLTFDKSDDDISRISITSDDSRTENIVNTTPVLIESSMDESRILEPSPKNESLIFEESKPESAVTPLKREGTFTKESSELVLMSPKVNISVNKTPVKRVSLSSPGNTPFPFSKSSQKETSMLNVTRSIEKSERRSSLVEAAPRTTRVMFCSPVNNPAVVMQQKRKVIKSNLKGSNKSFIFDESVSEPPRGGTRKRSYTQSDADDARVKRKRLADDQLQSVARLSRPRTSSATVKLSEPSTPSKKLTTPLKKNLTPSNAKSEAKVSRTKLPNFAALHQKQFAKMESLDECQVRRAKRAKQLLTPTGALAIIEKSSPKSKVTTNAEPTKVVKEVPKKTDAEVPKKVDPEVSKKTDTEALKKTATEVTKKIDTPSKASKVPTFGALDSLRPGYTRFGFKMNLDVNPFSIPPKPDAKPKEPKPNGLVTRQPSQPSLNGATSGRREVAKQIVMRERSFTSLTDKRKEKRTMIKGVRTNRRFELQMKLRNING